MVDLRLLVIEHPDCFWLPRVQQDCRDELSGASPFPYADPVSPHVQRTYFSPALMDGLGLLPIVELERVGEREEDASLQEVRTVDDGIGQFV